MFFIELHSSEGYRHIVCTYLPAKILKRPTTMRASDKAKKIWKYLIESESWLRRNILIASPHLTTPQEMWKTKIYFFLFFFFE